jgi:hypothetical protein
MNDYGGLSRAVREEIEQIKEAENLELETKKRSKQKPENDNFWQKLRDNTLLIINKAPK